MIEMNPTIDNELEKPTVFLIDDEDTFREGLTHLLQASGYNVESYPNAREYLENLSPQKSGCLVLDLDMPEINGLDLQKILNKKKIKIPIIFISGHGNIPKSVQAIKGGALDFLEKPFRKDALLDRIHDALILHAKKRKKDLEENEIRKRYYKLTARLKQILALLVAGNSNKEIAKTLTISHRTVEIHRKKIMEKMKANSLPELVKLATICGVDAPPQEKVDQA